MSKIICDICGTAYPETAESCPICGWRKSNKAPELTSDELDLDAIAAELNQVSAEKNGKENVDSGDSESTDCEDTEETYHVTEKKAKPIFDFDAVNTDDSREIDLTEGDADEDDDEEEEDESRSNPFLVVILIILIVALLLTSGFIFWRYYLPNHNVKPTEITEPISEETELPTETEVPTVPCTGLTLVSGMEKLTSEGQNWLLHVKAVPEDTTDLVTFVSDDPNVVTVNEEGRVTVVGEGQTKIIISCGAQKIECPVTVSYEEDTEPTQETQSLLETQAPVATEAPVQTEAPTVESTPAVNSDVTLKLKKTDMIIGRRGVYVTLELDCDLTADQVEWSTLDANVAMVDEKGNVTARNPGLTNVIVKYGNQEAVCIVRCVF